jgi:hypothetical protein
MEIVVIEADPRRLARQGVTLRGPPAGGGAPRLECAFLDGFQDRAFMGGVRRTGSARVQETPFLAGQEGRFVRVASQRSRAYVDDVDVVVAEAGIAADPHMGQVDFGMVLAARPAVSADGAYVTLELHPARSHLRGEGIRSHRAPVGSLRMDVSDLRLALRDGNGNGRPDPGELWCADTDGDGALTERDRESAAWCVQVPSPRHIAFVVEGGDVVTCRGRIRLAVPNGGTVLLRGLDRVLGGTAPAAGERERLLLLRVIAAQALPSPVPGSGKS